VPYEQTYPRCGREFVGEDKHAVADAVVEHARPDRHHALDRDIVLAHLEGVHRTSGTSRRRPTPDA
jgi:hypothetical protein